MDKLPQARNYIKEHKKMSIWYKLVISMASIVVFLTTYMLILPAITMETDAVCAIEAHTHGDECFVTELVLNCGFDEGEDVIVSGEAVEAGHIHTEECYIEDKCLVCGLEEHIHIDSCYPQEEEQAADTAEDNCEIVLPTDVDNESYGNLGDYIVNIGVVETTNAFENIVKYSTSISDVYTLYHKPPDNYTVNAVNTTYNAVTESFEANLKIEFVTTKEEIVDNSNTFIYQIPEEIDIDLTNIELNKTYTNYEGDAEKFDYQFILGDDGYYYIVAVFRQDYLDSILDSSTPITGYISAEVLLGGELAESDGSISIDFGDDIVLEIPASEIEYPSNSTADYDIQSSKSGSYDSASNTLTYKVIVYSRKGTTDTITFADSLANIDGITIESCDITVTKAQQEFFSTANGSYTTTYNLYVSDETVAVDAEVDLDTGTIEMELPGLAQAYREYDSNGNYMDYCNAYVITYTYTLGELAEGTTLKVGNDVEVSADITTDLDISSESTITTTINKTSDPVLYKTALKSGETITWTITVGNGTESLENGSITDTMFSELTASDISIVPDDVNTSPASVIIVTDDDGNVTSIDFNEGCENQYTITYTTTVEGWVPHNVTNTVTYTDSEGNETTGTAGINGVYAGSVSKSDGTLKGKNDDGTMSVEWTATFNVPIGGIPTGTVITDNLRNTEAGHYLSYEDAIAIIAAINSSEAWANKLGNLKFKTEDDTWYDADSITSDMTLVAFSFEFLEDVYQSDCDDGETSFDITYTTTIDVSDVTQSTTYYNNLSVPYRWLPDGTYTYNKMITKTDKNGKTADSATTNSDGYVTWIVIVNTDNGSYEDMQIVDNLPSELELEKLEISHANYNYNEVTLDETTKYWYGSADTLEVDASVDDDNVLTVDISVIEGIEDIPTNIYLRYTCKIKDEEMPESGETQEYELSNSAEVIIDGESGGVASQSQTVTVDLSDVVKNPVEKGQTWDYTSQLLNCVVELNPYAEQYGDGESYKFIDTLSYRDGYDDSTETSQRNYELVKSSVKLYYAVVEEYEDDEGRINTRLVKGEEVPASEWSYVYTTQRTDTSYNYNVNNVITAQLPDCVALIFEYSYLLDFKAAGYDTGIGATNEAVIDAEIEGNSHKVTSNDTWKSSGTSAGITTGQAYTLYKVSQGNYNSVLKNATFALYAYNAQTGKYEDTGKEFISDSNGVIEVSYTKHGLELNTMYYLVESKPPDGYELPEEPEKLYFYISGTSDTSNMPDTLPDGAVDLTNEKPVKYMENTAISTTSIGVEKQWYDVNGELTTAGADSITANLYRLYKVRDLNPDTVNVTYNILDHYGSTAYSGTKSLEVGSDAQLVITYKGDVNWAPKVSLTVGDDEINIAYAESSAWDENASYIYSFTATQDMSVSGVIEAFSDQYDFAISEVSVAPEDDPDYVKESEPYASYVLSDSNSWATVVNDLPTGGIITLADGTEVYADFAYVFEEAVELENYKTTYEKSGDTVIIKNTWVDKKYIEVIKKWFNADGTEQTKAASDITFNLYKKIVENVGSTVDISVDVSGSDTWNGSFENTWTFERGATVELVITNNFIWWYPGMNIQIGSAGSIVNGEGSSDGWVQEGNSATYTYQFVVGDDTDEITGTINTGSDTWTIDIVKVADASVDESGDNVLDTELVGTYTVEGPQWQTSLDITSLPTEGTYTKTDGTTVPVIYTYYVEEVPVSGYTTSYENNDGINEGIIKIINTADENQDFQLPETGGMGTTKMYTIGGLLIILCAAYFLYKRNLLQGGKNSI